MTMEPRYVGPKVFTVDQANRSLPHVKQLLEALRAQQGTLRTLEQAVVITELEGLQHDGIPSRAARVKASAHTVQLGAGVGQLQETLEQLEALGCQLKDLDEGLVDFFTVHQGQLVFLCWKDGEPDVRFWHFLAAGFAGRRPITELANN